MGYETKYKLVDVQGDSADAFWDDFDVHEVQTDDGTPLSSIFYNHNESSPRKWYDWKEDFKKISFEYPNTLFTLRGIGENAEDLWVGYARNGWVEKVKARIEYDEPSHEILTNSPTLEQTEKFKHRQKKAQLRAQRAEIDRQLEELQ